MKPLLLLAILAIPALCQIVPNSYIVELSGEPAAPYSARRGHRPHVSDATFSARVEAIRGQQAQVKPQLEQHGARVVGATRAALNALVVEIADSRAAELAAIPDVVKIHPVHLYHPALDRALPIHHVPDAWATIGGQSNAGAGIKIAIIDTGIDNTHPAFQDSAFPALDGYPQLGQESDRKYTNNKIIVVRSYGSTASTPATGQDVDGHGTGVAMVAAGGTTTGPYGMITGVAPMAYLGSYKVFPTSAGAPTNLIIQAIDDAIGDGMDVMNLSLGSTPAERPTDDPLVSAVENAVAAGRIVTIAAGNVGPDPNTIGSPGTSPGAITVGSMRNDRVFSAIVSVNGGSPVRALPGSGANSPTPISAPVVDIATQDSSGLGCSALQPGSLNNSIAFILRGTCTFETKLNNAAAAGAVAALLYAAPDSPDAVNMAVGAATLPASMVNNADGSQVKQQLAGGGQVTLTMDFRLTPLAVDPDRVSSFSSLGPNTDGGIKPDVLAVGESVSLARPLKNDGSANDGYVVESGTSFSSPMMAGAAALLKAARPGLSVNQYRSLLINTASAFTTLPDIQSGGAGFLNLQAALQSTATAKPTSLSFGTGGSTVNQSATLRITNLGNVTDTFSINVVPQTGSATPVMSTSSVQLDPGQSQDVTVQLNAGGLSAGANQGMIQIQPSQGPVTLQVPYWYDVPSGVPARITSLYSPLSGKANTSQTIFIRVTDDTGAAVAKQPTATITSGTGRVGSIVSEDRLYPGAYLVNVTLGTGTATTFRFTLGNLTKDVTIPIQ